MFNEMSEGMRMLILMVATLGSLFFIIIRPQIRRERKWDEEDMIDPKKDEKAQEDDDE